MREPGSFHPSPSPNGPLAAPFITSAVGDVARPSGPLAANRDLAHFPGRTGVLASIANIAGLTRHGVDHLVAEERRFGPVFRAQTGPTAYVHVGDPELIAKILRNEDRVWSSAIAWQGMFAGLEPSRRSLDFLLAMDFEPHRDARKLMQPAFGSAATEGYLNTAIPMFEEAIDDWVRSGSVDFKKRIRVLLGRISTRTFLGVEDERDASVIERASSDVWNAVTAVTKNPWLSLKQRRAIAGYARLVASLRPRVAERRARGGADLFSRLCAEDRPAEWLDDDAMIRVFIGVLLAAFDTTACGLASMAYLLAKYPEWQERLREEARSIGRPRISYDETKRLELTDRAWKETLRLMPVVTGTPRIALRDTELGPWSIRAGTFVNAMVATAGRAGTAWTDPDRFDPDRFREDRAEDRNTRGLFLPFGSGAHACVGMHLATVETKAFWHALLTRCRFRLARDYEARHVYTPLGVVSGGVTLRVERL